MKSCDVLSLCVYAEPTGAFNRAISGHGGLAPSSTLSRFQDLPGAVQARDSGKLRPHHHCALNCAMSWQDVH